MDPDRNLRFMNRFMKTIRKEHPDIFLGLKKYWIRHTYTLHTHRHAALHSIYFARLSRRLSKNGLREQSDILLSYAIHYLVDCATPVHAGSLISVKDYVTRRHRSYEDHLEATILAGTLDLLYSIQAGIKEGVKQKTRYALENAQALTRFSSGLYKPLLSSVRGHRMSEAEDITRQAFTRLGSDLAVFLTTFNDPSPQRG
jgi:hypothetical protein